MPLARETVILEESLNAADNLDVDEALMDMDDDKTCVQVAMGVSKAIGTVRSDSLNLLGVTRELMDVGFFFRLLRPSRPHRKFWRGSRRLLFRLSFTLWSIDFLVRFLFSFVVHILMRLGGCVELLDHMYDLIDSLTFKSSSIFPTIRPVFEVVYKLFKSEAIDFLDGEVPSTRSSVVA